MERTLPTPPTHESNPRGNRVKFSLAIARALQGYGLPTHRLEATMDRIHQRLGIEGHFFIGPSSIIASFGSDEDQQTFIQRPLPGDVNLEKLDRIHSLSQRVARGELDANEGHLELEALVNEPDRYGMWSTILCFILSSAGAARLFGGGWREVAVSGGIGLLVATLLFTISRVPNLARIIPLIASMCAMTVAHVMLLWLGSYSVYISTVTGLIVLLPGLSLTVAMTELATGHAISGSARFAMSSVTFIMMGFGIALGDELGGLLAQGLVMGEPLPLPAWSQWVALVLVPLTFVVLFKARPRDWIWVLLACMLAFHTARLGSIHLGPELGTFLASFCLTLGANCFARFSRRPASIFMVPGVMLLVPGSVGYQSLTSMLAHNTLSGVESAFNMILLAVALVSGILFANGVFPTRTAM